MTFFGSLRKIIEYIVENKDVVDDYGFKVSVGQPFIKGHFLEMTNNRKSYKEVEKDRYFYKETVVYPFGQFESHTNGEHFLSIQNYVDILRFTEQSVYV